MIISVQAATELVTALLGRMGVPPTSAAVTARSVVTAEWWGVTSHGLMRMPFYLDRLEHGGYVADAELRTVRDTGALVVLDGGGGIGHWQLWSAAEMAAQRCAERGVGVVAVANSGHCGALGVYTAPPLARGQVCLVFSHGPAAMPAWGGHSPLLSTSPFAAGIPCRPRAAIVDMASSTVARGTIAEYAARDEAIPEGWATDAAGQPTRDAATALAGMLSPLGGAKGFALAFVVEALSAGLVGPALSADVPDMFVAEQAARPQRLGHLVIALDPGTFDAGDGTSPQARLDDLAARVVAAGGRLPGARRDFPGEWDPDAELRLAPRTATALQSWATRLGVPMATHDRDVLRT